MLMARTSHINEFQGGSLPSERPQLPSFSHFLSGVQDAESSGLRPSPPLPHSGTHHTPRHDVFSSINPFAQPKRRSTGSSMSASQPDDHFSGLARTMFPAGRHSPPQPESQPAARFSATQPYQVHDENVSSQETSVHGSAHHDGSRTKTVVREDYVSGKGLCYVYDDGSVCPKAINGHIVNPKWGTTKAGKPRKRLGQACNTCREKKIRCDPQVPKCTQCQKFGRECKFETGKSSQTGHSSSPMTPEPQKDSLADRHGSNTPAETASEQHPSRQTSRGSINVEHLSPASTAISDEGPARKRRRVSATPMDKSPAWQASFKPYQSSPSDMENDTKPAREFSASVDPFDVDQRLTLRYVRHYMDNVNNGLCHIFPMSVFSSWTSVDQSRRSSALGVLYAMMAFGATYSSKNHSREDERSRTFVQIAEACLGGERAQPSCYDAVTNLILSYLAMLNGEISKSKYLNAKSVEICYNLGMNTEEGLDRLVSEFGPWFNLRPTIAKESMRRLFWLLFVKSCFQKYAKPESVDKSRLECALRLPCDDTSYESGVVPALPVFRCNDSERQAGHPRPGHGPIAYFVEIALVLDEAIQNQSLAASHKFQEFESFLQKARSRLSVFDRALRTNFSDSQQAGTATHGGEMRRPTGNLLSSGTSGIHLFYHLAAMVLNRHVPWHSLSAECVDRCVKETYNHAVQTMDLLNRLEDGGTTMHFARMSRGSPITALTVLAAVDVITAAGPISEIFEHQDEGGKHGLKKMVTCALETLEEHSRHWAEAETQSSLVQERLKLLLSLRYGQSNSQKAFYFRTPLHSPYGMDLDIVYGLPHADYLKALGWGDRVQGKGDMMEMGVHLLEEDAVSGVNDHS